MSKRKILITAIVILICTTIATEGISLFIPGKRNKRIRTSEIVKAYSPGNVIESLDNPKSNSPAEIIETSGLPELYSSSEERMSSRIPDIYKYGKIAGRLFNKTGIPEKGDTVSFGMYEGNKIEWIVIAVENDTALLISKNVLWYDCFNDSIGDFPWESCSLRKKLNNVFYRKSFTNEERKLILKTNLANTDTPHEGKDSDCDYIFLLNVEECEKYFEDNNDRKCGEWWWLRGDNIYKLYDRKEPAVDPSGMIFHYGTIIWWNDYGVRPVMWINLKR